jgi:hypothetical protein
MGTGTLQLQRFKASTEVLLTCVAQLPEEAMCRGDYVHGGVEGRIGGGGMRVGYFKLREDHVVHPILLPPRRCSAPAPTRNDNTSPFHHRQPPSPTFHR